MSKGYPGVVGCDSELELVHDRSMHRAKPQALVYAVRTRRVLTVDAQGGMSEPCFLEGAKRSDDQRRRHSAPTVRADDAEQVDPSVEPPGHGLIAGK